MGSLFRSLNRWLSVAALAVACAIGATREARAQGFINPFIGSNFGGNVGCRGSGRVDPGTPCQDGTLNIGGAVGAMWDSSASKKRSRTVQIFLEMRPASDSRRAS